mgnify:CR=1 FL=1
MSKNYFFASRREGGFSHEEKRGNAKGASGKIRKATVRLGADTSNPTFFPRPDIAIKRRNGSETSKLHKENEISMRRRREAKKGQHKKIVV